MKLAEGESNGILLAVPRETWFDGNFYPGRQIIASKPWDPSSANLKAADSDKTHRASALEHAGQTRRAHQAAGACRLGCVEEAAQGCPRPGQSDTRSPKPKHIQPTHGTVAYPSLVYDSRRLTVLAP